MYTSYAVTLYMHVVQGVQKLHLYQNTMGAPTLTHILCTSNDCHIGIVKYTTCVLRGPLVLV